MCVCMYAISVYVLNEAILATNTYVNTHVYQPALCDGVLNGIKAAVGESWSREQLYDAVDLGSYDGSSMETERVMMYTCIYLLYVLCP